MHVLMLREREGGREREGEREEGGREGERERAYLVAPNERPSVCCITLKNKKITSPIKFILKKNKKGPISLSTKDIVIGKKVI